ncbi:uncharacterized protein [Palaemon carinicauda]|uniref:uncharacterized protein isoform X3 n=1 Tax=Palaemon carinicauda TaxID=392227 RepID=UPI0035B68110
MGGQVCCANNCTNSRTNSPEMSFFKFPNREEHLERCKKWVHNLNRKFIVPELLMSPQSARSGGSRIIGTKRLALCEDHFTAEQFMNPAEKGKPIKRKHLRPDAVPTVFDLPKTERAVASEVVKRNSPKRRRTSTDVSFPGKHTKCKPIKRKHLRPDAVPTVFDLPKTERAVASDVVKRKSPKKRRTSTDDSFPGELTKCEGMPIENMAYDIKTEEVTVKEEEIDDEPTKEEAGSAHSEGNAIKLEDYSVYQMLDDEDKMLEDEINFNNDTEQLLPTSTFYHWGAVRTKWVAPQQGYDSELEVDDDTIDSDFLPDVDDDELEHEVSDIPKSIFYGRRLHKLATRNLECIQEIELNEVLSEEEPDDDNELPVTSEDFHQDIETEGEASVFEDRSTIDAGIENTPHSFDENENVVLEIGATSETPGTISKLFPTSWKVADSEVSSSHDYLGQDPIFNDDLRQPFQYVCDFLDDDIMDTIVAQSNLYAIQKNPNKPLNVDRSELEQWLGLSIYFSLSKLPNIRMHWSTQLGPLREIAADVMSRNRWEEIKSKFHMADNSILDSNPRGNRDKLFKVRPLFDKLRSKFQQIPMTQNLCIDEQLAPFKGDSSFKQYILSKPHKYGYKFMVLADSQGMTYDFMPYTGKIDPVDDQNVPDLGASANNVLHLAQVIPANCNHLLFFNNWFTSVPLMQHLSTRGIWCCGTVRVPRLPGIKNSKDAEKALMNKGRGAYEELRSTGEGCEVTYVKWYDNKIVNIVSTFAKANPVSKVSRYDRKLKCRIDVNCPDVILQYKKSMGGVDLADCLISLYRITIRSKKYYHCLIFHMIDMVIVNSWLLYQRDGGNLHIPKLDILPLAVFKLKVAFAFMKRGKSSGNLKRGRLSSLEGKT